MSVGPGIYDPLCTLVREQTDAKVAIVVVIDGINGNGFSIQSLGIPFMQDLPELLEAMAKQIRQDIKS